MSAKDGYLLGYTVALLFMLVETAELWEDSGFVYTHKACTLDDFTASCDAGKLLVVTSAMYGRRQPDSPCVDESLGHFDCEADVLLEMDEKCSGRPSCTYSVVELHKSVNARGAHSACPGGIHGELTVHYRCQAVYQAAGAPCLQGTGLAVDLTGDPVLIPNHLTLTGGQGSATCPWLVSTDRDMRVSVTLVNFRRRFRHDTAAATQGGDQGVPLCFIYAYIYDGDSGEKVPLSACEDHNRTSWKYTSRSSRVRIHVPNDNPDNTRFFLFLQVTGCVNRFAADAGWWLREGEDGASGTLRCNHTGHQWQVTCVDSQWHGLIGDCSPLGTNPHGQEQDVSLSVEFPLGILLVVAVGVALGVFLGGLLLLCFSRYIKRKHERDGHQAALQYALTSNYISDAELERARDRKPMHSYNTSTGVYDKCDTGAHCYGAVPQVHCTGTLSRTKVPLYDTRDSVPGQMVRTHACTHSDRDSV